MHLACQVLVSGLMKSPSMGTKSPEQTWNEQTEVLQILIDVRERQELNLLTCTILQLLQGVSVKSRQGPEECEFSKSK